MDNSRNFRYWDNRFNRWVRGETVYLSSNGMAFLDVDPHGVDISGKVRIYPVDSLELVWSTGRHDSTTWDELTEDERAGWTRAGNMPSEWKGKEIYEFDVVEASIYGDETPQVLTVEYRETCFVIDYEDSDSDCVPVGSFVGRLKIIGNQFEHPELLEGK